MIINKISYPEPEVDYREIMRYLGVKAPKRDFTPEENEKYAEENARVLSMLNECLNEVKPLLRYDACYGEMSAEELEAAGMEWTELFHKMRSVVLFGCTIGYEIDRLIAKYSVTSVSKAQCFEAIGTERVEALANAFNKDVAMMAKEEGLFCMRRVSPGYGKFKLEAQKDLCGLLNTPKNIGVTLTESLLMQPVKSVTAVIGIDDMPELSGCDTNKCASCSIGNCQFKEK